MKKRIFIPTSFGYLLLELLIGGTGLLILFAFIAIDLDVLYTNIDTTPLESILVFCSIIFVFYTFIRLLLACKITLKENEIYKCGDGLPKFEKIQYKCSIKYTDIKNVSIIASANDSRNKRIQLKWISSSVAKKYLEFEQINNNKKIRMCINYYTKKQVIKMLNYVNNKMQQLGNRNILNIEAIMQDWFKFDKSSKKKQIEQ